MLPRARKHELVVQAVANDVIVYDRARNRAHCLNRTTALVWRHCDGRTSIAALAARLASELGIPADERLVWMALRQLDKAGLLSEHVRLPSDVVPMTRRQAIALGVAGAAALLLPACESMTAPFPGVSLDVSVADDTCRGKHDIAFPPGAPPVLVIQACVQRGQCNFAPREIFNQLCSQRFDAACRKLTCPAGKNCRARLLAAVNILAHCEAQPGARPCGPNQVLCRCFVRNQGGPFPRGGHLTCQCECV